MAMSASAIAAVLIPEYAPIRLIALRGAFRIVTAIPQAAARSDTAPQTTFVLAGNRPGTIATLQPSVQAGNVLKATHLHQSVLVICV